MSLAKADELYDKRDWNAAIYAYRGCIEMDVVKTDDDKTNAYFSLGVAYGHAGDIPESLKWFDKVVAVGVSNFHTMQALAKRSSLYRERKQYALALFDITRAIRETDSPAAKCRYLTSRADLFRDMKLSELEIADLLAIGEKDTVSAGVVNRIEALQKTIESGAASDANTLSAKFKEMKDIHSAEMKAVTAELKATSDTLRTTQDAFAALQKRVSELEKLLAAVANEKTHRVGIVSGTGTGGSGSGGSEGSAVTEPHPP